MWGNFKRLVMLCLQIINYDETFTTLIFFTSCLCSFDIPNADLKSYFIKKWYIIKLHFMLYILCIESESHSVMSNSLWPQGLYIPWNSPGQNTGVSSLSLLQGIFPTQGSNPGLLHCRQILYQLNHKGSPRHFNIYITSFNI